jgi:hypothetical protein
MRKLNYYPWLKQYVISTRMPNSPDTNVELVSSSATDFVRALKQTPGKAIYLSVVRIWLRR